MPLLVTLRIRKEVLELVDDNTVQFLDDKNTSKKSCCQFNNSCDISKEYLITPRVIENGKRIQVFNFLIFENT